MSMWPLNLFAPEERFYRPDEFIGKLSQMSLALKGLFNLAQGQRQRHPGWGQANKNIFYPEGVA